MREVEVKLNRFAFGRWLVVLTFLLLFSYHALFLDDLLVQFLSVLMLGCFGAGWVFMLRKLVDGSAGLVLNKNGLIDRSSGVSAGFVPWSDVVEIAEHRNKYGVSIHFKLRDPQKYLKKGSMFQRALKRISLTPVAISSRHLKIDSADLFALISGYLEQNRSQEQAVRIDEYQSLEEGSKVKLPAGESKFGQREILPSNQT